MSRARRAAASPPKRVWTLSESQDSKAESGAGREPGGIPGPESHPAGLAFAAAAFAAGLFLLSQAGSQLAWRPGVEFFRQPGFFSLISILGMLLFGALHLGFLWRGGARASGLGMIREVAGWARAAEFAAWFMAYALAVPYAGYILTTVAFCALLAARLGYRTWRMLAAAAMTGVCAVVVFKAFLGVRIPGGAVYELLPPAIRNFMVLYL